MDCVIEDHTGHTKIQLWDDMIEKCKNSSSCDITDLSIKNYNGHKHLGSTYDTTIKEINMHVANPQRPQLVTNIQKTATIQEFIFTVFSWPARSTVVKRKYHMQLDLLSSQAQVVAHARKSKGWKRLLLLSFLFK